jgi:hypothetical protein
MMHSSFERAFAKEGKKIQQEIAFTLTLESGGKEVEVFSGHIETVQLALYPYGFDGRIYFSGFENGPLNEIIVSTDPIQISLSYDLWDGDEKPLPFTLKGLVVDKYVKQVKKTSEDLIQTEYCLDFSDMAKVVWSNHFPISIYTNKSMREVIDDQTNSLFEIDYDWEILEPPHPVLAFSLEYKDQDSRGTRQNFYHFLHWFLHKENGILTYDYTSNTYLISGEKQEGSDPVKLYEKWVTTPIYRLPEPPRFEQRILSHSPERMTEEKNSFAPTYESIRSDLFDLDDQRIYPEQTALPVGSDLSINKSEVELHVETFDNILHLTDLFPGALLLFQGDKVRGPSWSGTPEFKEKSFRVKKMVVEARKPVWSENIDKPVETYRLDIDLLLEEKEETHVFRPPFSSPSYPFYIQGTISSQIGDEMQTTYEVDEKVQEGQYLVEIPLVGNEAEKLVVPFFPNLGSGQYYFPLCKGEKVLLAVYFQTAQISRVLGWQPLAQLPPGVQGNQIVLASNGKDSYTVLKHEFVEGNASVFTIEQSSSSTQKRIIELKDEMMTHTVVNPEKKTMIVTHHEEAGSSWVLKDSSSGVTQEVVFDGQAIIQTCTGSAGTTTITQTPDAVDIKCKTFTINAEDINLVATNSIIQEGATKVDIKTQIASVDASTVNLG